MSFVSLAGRRALFTAALAATLLSTPLAAVADETRRPDPGVITVSAEGVATIAPDMAVVSLGVVREAETARAALDANNEAMTQVLAAMKDEGIAERDLQTGAFSIQPRWFYPPNRDGQAEQPRITGYTVNNTLTLRIRDLSRLGAILDASVSLGVNQGGDVIFTNDDQETIREAARRDAVVKAKAKAATLTEALGVGLGRITQISENSLSAPPMPMVRAEMAMMSAKSDSSVPVASGENEYRVSVSVSWELAQQ
ncbi:SIMPL domain-containing protein [Hoeflea sp. YIM 152468]|uniref:SIMPL domain-containing protein n=1 Tax=Hoeflea sp. YIM 152468 TaxID=3031759 RepID=UPI0023DC4835|nr:SIMPL domain-containing protein [Hoeflea sp. YIM 152468]MDF1609622.1 SIMPL domain-containing protein [Hoeflea sp. YIM 152468]